MTVIGARGFRSGVARRTTGDAPVQESITCAIPLERVTFTADQRLMGSPPAVNAVPRPLIPLVLALLAFSVYAAWPLHALGKTSHAGWPKINGMLLMNKNDSNRPLDARPGRDPFAGHDASYRCDTIHHRCKAPSPVPHRPRHNELLGGHGNDRIHAGPWGDVIWGDYKPKGQPRSQADRIWGGNGRDHIYASHGWNGIRAGGGDDWIKAHWGHGIIDCGGGRDLLYISRRAMPGYKIRHCERISHRTLGY